MTSSTRPASPSASPGVQRPPGGAAPARALARRSRARRWRRRPRGAERRRRWRSRGGDAAGRAVELARAAASARVSVVGLGEPARRPSRSARASRTDASSAERWSVRSSACCERALTCASFESWARPAPAARTGSSATSVALAPEPPELISELWTKPPSESTTRIARSAIALDWSGRVDRVERGAASERRRRARLGAGRCRCSARRATRCRRRRSPRPTSAARARRTSRQLRRWRRRCRRCRCSPRRGDHEHDDHDATAADARRTANRLLAQRDERRASSAAAVRGSGPRRARRAARPTPGRGRGGRRGGASRDQASTASRSLVMARCRSVPALRGADAEDARRSRRWRGRRGT